jgi:membrane protease YdiL (CAAX protease family)
MSDSLAGTKSLYGGRKDESHHRSLHQWMVLIFAMTFPSAMAWLYFVALAAPMAGPGEKLRGSPIVIAVYAGAKVVQFALPIFWVWFFDRESFRALRPSGRGLGLGLGFGVVAAAAILIVYFGLLRGSAMLARTPVLVQEKVTQFGASSPARYVMLALFLSVAHSLLEEYYWRWFVFGELRKAASLIAAMVLSSLAFMGHHVIVLAMYFPAHLLTAAVPFSLCVAVGGGVWAWIYHRSRSLYSPWVSHILVDAAIMAIGYDMVFIQR